MIQCIKKSICCLPAADYLPLGPGGHLERRWSQADTDGSTSSISIRLVWKRHGIASQGRHRKLCSHLLGRKTATVM